MRLDLAVWTYVRNDDKLPKYDKTTQWDHGHYDTNENCLVFFFKF